MKRDMELVRLLLMEVEGEDAKTDVSAHSHEKQVYHMALLIEAGLVDGVVTKNAEGFPVRTTPMRLTWNGHEFLDAARNEKNWRKTTKKIQSEGISIGFELLKTVLIETAKDRLKLHGILHGG